MTLSAENILLQAFYQMKERAALVTSKATHENYRPLGICSQLDNQVECIQAGWEEKRDARELFHKILESEAMTWPRHSGCSVYPVPYTDTEWLKNKWKDLEPWRQRMYADVDLTEDEEPDMGAPFESCPKAGLAELAFDYLPQKCFWDSAHPYGKARLEFLEYLIEIVKQRISGA